MKPVRVSYFGPIKRFRVTISVKTKVILLICEAMLGLVFLSLLSVAVADLVHSKFAIVYNLKSFLSLIFIFFYIA